MTMLRVAEGPFGPTIQGEGPFAGRPAIFTRLGGCDYRCSWCDSMHAVDSKHRFDWKPIESADLARQIVDLAGGRPVLHVLTGGNPCIQDCAELIEALADAGIRTQVETQGSIWPSWLNACDVVVSPKPPSSGHGVDLEGVAMFAWKPAHEKRLAVKVVVKDEADLEFAMLAAAAFGPHVPFFVSPCNPEGSDGAPPLTGMRDAYRWLCERIAALPGAERWRVIPQLHVFAWGSERGR